MATNKPTTVRQVAISQSDIFHVSPQVLPSTDGMKMPFQVDRKGLKRTEHNWLRLHYLPSFEIMA